MTATRSLGDSRRSPRIAVVTGGSSGIGAATARALARRGWRCVLLARGEERLRVVAGEVGGEWEVCDVAERAEVERVAAAVRGRHAAIGLLVLNAGIPGGGDFLRLDPERIEQVVRVNYLGSVWALRAFLPALEAATPADVVTIVSVAGTVAYGPSGPYTAAKHAQLAFSRSVQAQLRPRGIRVHTIKPGFVRTPGFFPPIRSGTIAARIAVRPERVAARVLQALDRDLAETFVPRWYAPAALAGLAPNLAARVARFGKARF